MFVVIYRFTIHPGKEDAFRKAWEGMTELFYRYAGSLGSRLHREDEVDFIAYAQWPDRELWENSWEHLPEEAEMFRAGMLEACSEISTLHTLDLVSDMIQNSPWGE